MSKSIDKSKMKCNSPRPLRKGEPGYGVKKRVVKACENGKEKLIKFGQKGYGHNYSAEAKRSFRARHGCSRDKSKMTASYWACKNLWGRNSTKLRPPKGK